MHISIHLIQKSEHLQKLPLKESIFRDTAPRTFYEIQRVISTPKDSESLRNSRQLSLILTHKRSALPRTSKKTPVLLFLDA